MPCATVWPSSVKQCSFIGRRRSHFFYEDSEAVAQILSFEVWQSTRVLRNAMLVPLKSLPFATGLVISRAYSEEEFTNAGGKFSTPSPLPAWAEFNPNSLSRALFLE